MKKYLILLAMILLPLFFFACEPLTTLDSDDNSISAINDTNVTHLTNTDVTNTQDTVNDDISATNDTDVITHDTGTSTSLTVVDTQGSEMN